MINDNEIEIISPFSYKEIDDFNKIYKTDFRVQGYTITEKCYLISAYDHLKKSLSRIYIYDLLGEYFGYIELDNNAHVGGLTYDSNNKIIFVTGKKGNIESYSLLNFFQVFDYPKTADSLALNSKILEKIFNGNINISNHFVDKTSASTIYYSNYDNCLYAVDCASNGTLIRYNIKFDSVTGNIISDNGQIISKKFASCCQGIATYKDEHDKNYIYASLSYGRNMPSVIKKYEIVNDDIIEVGAFIIERAGLEGIYIDSLGNLSCIFENFDGIDNLNITYNVKINSLDFSKKLTELDNDLESYYKKQGQANKDRLNRR